MSADDDTFWDTVANQLRNKKGFGPLTDEEAASALDGIPDEAPPSLEEALRVVEQLIREEPPRAERADRRAAEGKAAPAPPHPEYGSICRNPGQSDAEAKARELRHIQDMLDEDDDDDETDD